MNLMRLKNIKNGSAHTWRDVTLTMGTMSYIGGAHMASE